MKDQGGNGGVDFRAARRWLESHAKVAPEVRQRAFACWVGLFDLADEQLRVERSSRELVTALGLSRVTWTQYRSLLETAGLLTVGPAHRGPRPQVLQLVPPILAS